jgi:hypothetical protein
MEELKFGKTVISVVRFEVISQLELIVAVVERIVMELTRIVTELTRIVTELTRIERIQSSDLVAIMAEKFGTIGMIGMFEFAVVQSPEQIVELVDSMKRESVSFEMMTKTKTRTVGYH